MTRFLIGVCIGVFYVMLYKLIKHHKKETSTIKELITASRLLEHQFVLIIFTIILTGLMGLIYPVMAEVFLLLEFYSLFLFYVVYKDYTGINIFTLEEDNDSILGLDKKATQGRGKYAAIGVSPVVNKYLDKPKPKIIVYSKDSKVTEDFINYIERLQEENKKYCNNYPIFI